MSNSPELRAVSQPAAENEVSETVATSVPTREIVRPRFPEENVQGSAARKDDAGVRQQHMAFHRLGQRPEDSKLLPPGPYTPALLFAWRDLSHIRHDYPCLLDPDDELSFAKPLRILIDALTYEAAGGEEEGQQQKRLLQRLEAEIKGVINEHPGELIGVAADLAVERIAASSGRTNGRLTAQLDGLHRIGKLLRGSSRLLNCTSTTARELFVAGAKWSWRRACAPWAEEFENLREGIQELLRAVEAESAEASDPERLKHALGTDDMDPEAMAAIVRTGNLEHDIPEARRARLQETLSILDRYRPLWRPAKGATAPFDPFEVLSACRVAEERVRARRAELTTLMRAVWVARLEVKNKYNEAAHNAFFDTFTWDHLDSNERALFPPVLVALDEEALRRETVEALHELLLSEAPVKVLLESHELAGAGDAWKPSAAASMAATALSMGTAYVLQAPLSHVGVIAHHLPDAFTWQHAALISIYSGEEDVTSERRFVDSASATEGRLWPLMIFDPGKGTCRADRIHMTGNPAPELDWPVESFECEDAAGAAVTHELAFTTADFLLQTDAWQVQFMAVPPEQWHDALCPVQEYITFEKKDAQGRIPFVWAVDAQGMVVKVIVGRSVSNAARRCRDTWRNLQEIGGIHDSFVERCLAEECVRLEKAKQAEVEAIKKDYEAKLDEQVSGLTQTIVSRIAAQLLGGKVTLPLAGAPATGAAAPAPATKDAPGAGGDAETAEKPAEEEDEGVSLEEAYIVTPLCTSCNECTNLNGRIFGYNENKQAFIKDAAAGPYRDLVVAAEKCPVRIIHPGKPMNPDEPRLDELKERAAPFM